MDDGGNRESKARPPSAIECRLWLCENCWYLLHEKGLREPAKVRILEISEIDSGWLASGHVAWHHCELCGGIYRALTRYIPIECAEYECRHCGPKSRMAVRVVKLSFANPGYLFVATLTCERCKKRQRFQRLLRPLWAVKRVKVGPTGVEVEREVK